MSAVNCSLGHILVNVGVRGVAFMWNCVFLSPAVGCGPPSYTCVGRWKAVNLDKQVELDHKIDNMLMLVIDEQSMILSGLFLT